ncbi:hypothetical protein [Armatimonas sp.]|uniref:hypothetical protein n=1 Tax=Armatimonas sp. TaxID=1872638 RepID=UPI00374DD695
MPITPIDVLKKLWEQRELLQKGWLSLQRTIKSGKTVIAVFGPGGVGKTTFGVYLAPDFDAAKVAKQYEESPGIEEQWLKLDTTQKIWIAPGQGTLRAGVLWPELFQKLTQAKQKAVIVFVVSYGHHTPSPGRRVDDWNLYLDEKQADELQQLESLVSFFAQSAVSDLRMMTLVTKEDLWWLHREEVQKHYEQGQYQETLQKLAIGRKFRHEFAYVTLRRENLKSAMDSAIGVPVAEGFDDISMYSHQERMITILKELIK